MSGKDDRLKSSVELALERLREQDRRKGIEEPRPLSEEQRSAISEIRTRYEARIAEAKILLESSRRKAVASGDVESLRKLDEEHARELARLERKRDGEIEAIREG